MALQKIELSVTGNVTIKLLNRASVINDEQDRIDISVSLKRKAGLKLLSDEQFRIPRILSAMIAEHLNDDDLNLFIENSGS